MADRSALVIRAATATAPGVLRIRVGRRATLYLYEPVPCEIGGNGWKVRRLGSAEPYYCRTGVSWAHLSCDCVGFEARGLCRHVLSLVTLEQAGKLTNP